MSHVYRSVYVSRVMERARIAETGNIKKLIHLLIRYPTATN